MIVYRLELRHYCYIYLRKVAQIASMLHQLVLCPQCIQIFLIELNEAHIRLRQYQLNLAHFRFLILCKKILLSCINVGMTPISALHSLGNLILQKNRSLSMHKLKCLRLEHSTYSIKFLKYFAALSYSSKNVRFLPTIANSLSISPTV